MPILRKLSLISILFLIFGLTVRLVQYFHNRSLWYDEASVALNIINRDYLELLQSLDYNQAAPPGFLWIEKTIVQIGGNNEYSLRLFPLIAGVISLFTFYYFARRYASLTTTTIAIALFSCLRYLVYYSTEVKQYSSDVMVALLLSLLLIPLCQQILTKNQVLLLIVVGTVAIWLSHPAVFILAGIELGYLLVAPRAKFKVLVLNRLPVYITWLISFAALYWFTINNTMGNESLMSSWRDRFPNSVLDLVWLLDSWGRFFHRPLGFIAFVDGVAMVAFAVGCVAYYRNNKQIFIALIGPFVATLIASYLQKYPFRDRLVLFLAPFAILIMAEGISFLLTQFPSQLIYVKILGLVMLLVILVPPLIRTSQLIVNPEYKEEVRPALAYIKSSQQPGDSLYVYRGGKNQFTYYAPKYGYQQGDYFLGEYKLPDDGVITADEKAPLEQEIQQLRGKERVWFLLKVSEIEQQEFLLYLNVIGKQIERFEQPSVLVYLYDLST